MSLRHHEIAEASHRILDPFTDAKLRLLGEVAGVGPGTRVLDLACGKGEMLCRWAEWFGSGGVGVDLSHVFLAAARERAEELGVAGPGLDSCRGTPAAYEAAPGAFDIASCVGATWIGGGLAGTMALLRPAVREAAWSSWASRTSSTSRRPRRWRRGGSGPTTMRPSRAPRSGSTRPGFELVEMVLADGDSWDRYEASQWGTVADWLGANPDDPDNAAMRRFLDENRRTYLRWGRRYLGWGVFVTRPR